MSVVWAGRHPSEGATLIPERKRLEQQLERAQSALREAQLAVAGLLEEPPGERDDEVVQASEETADLAALVERLERDAAGAEQRLAEVEREPAAA